MSFAMVIRWDGAHLIQPNHTPEQVFSYIGPVRETVNPNDVIRDKILRYLYSVHTTSRGLKGVAIGIRDLQRAMKEQGVKQNEVSSNLDYLIQKGWVREEVVRRSFTTPGGTTRASETTKFKISDIGIDRLQGASTFRFGESLPRINVTSIHGVTVIGKGAGTVVNVEHTDLSSALEELEAVISVSRNLSEAQKLNALADIGTVRSQLSKPKPNYGVIKTIWSGIEKMATGSELAGMAITIAQLISKLPH